MITVEIISNFESFLQIEEEWNRLLENTLVDSVFLRHEWFKCWWQAFGDGKKLNILLIREGDDLIGISPLMISKDYFRGFPIRKIGFIENEETPYSNFIVLHNSKQVIEEMINHLIGKKELWHVASFNKIPQNTDAYEMLQTVCKKKGMRFLVRPSLNSPFLPIDTDWDTFYRNKSQRFKKRLRYNNNQIEKLGMITIEECSHFAPIRPFLNEAFSIGQKSWKNKIGKSISSTTENETFFSEVASVANAKRWLSLWIMRIDGRPIAFEFHLKYKGRVHGLRSEFDEEYSAYSPGSVLDSHIVKSIFTNGFIEYDMGGSDDVYKKYWTPHIRNHFNILIFNEGIYPGVLRYLEEEVIPCLKKVKAFWAIKNVLLHTREKIGKDHHEQKDLD